MASFPYLKTFDDYDFEFQPSLNKLAVLDLKNLRFIENKENVLFIGTPGTGKTHLATAIGMEAVLIIKLLDGGLFTLSKGINGTDFNTIQINLE